MKDKISPYGLQRVSTDCTYIFGNDPAWGVTSNRLSMSNGVKMKMSVIFGVLHMMIGILHKYTNTIYHGHWSHLITECIGGTIILLGLFGWMDLLVVAKWTKDLDIEDHNPAKPVFMTQDSKLHVDANKEEADYNCPVEQGNTAILTQE